MESLAMSVQLYDQSAAGRTETGGGSPETVTFTPGNYVKYPSCTDADMQSIPIVAGGGSLSIASDVNVFAANCPIFKFDVTAKVVSTGDSVKCKYVGRTVGTDTQIEYDATSIGVGQQHACFVVSASDNSVTWGGDVTCVGNNDKGQAGNKAAVTVTIGGVSQTVGYTMVAVGATHTCGTTADGTMRCWGGSSSITLGTEHVRTAEAGPFVYVSAGQDFTCAIHQGTVSGNVVTDQGKLECWGKNPYLASGWSKVKASTVGVSYLTVSVGTNFACALKESDSTLQCWGRDDFGLAANVPTGATKYKNVAVGWSPNACAIEEATGNPYCWGRQWKFEEVGQDTIYKKLYTAYEFDTITVSDSWFCGKQTSDSTLSCVGAHVPRIWQSSSTMFTDEVAEISASTEALCVVDTEKEVHCYGRSAYGAVISAAMDSAGSITVHSDF